MFAHKLPLNYKVETYENRSIIPYAALCRGTMDMIIGTYKNEKEFPSEKELVQSYLVLYRLMFETALLSIWELYSKNQRWDNYMEPVNEILSLLVKKHRDYGPMNIWTFKHHGIVIRMNDKVARLENLGSTGRETQNESVIDSFQDLAGYSIVGGMLAQDLFLLPLKEH